MFKRLTGFVVGMAVLSTPSLIMAQAPQGASEVSEGIYMLESTDGIGLLNSYEKINIDTVPPNGTFIHPPQAAGISVGENDEWLMLQSNKKICVNLAGDKHIVFGDEWLTIGEAEDYIYYISADKLEKDIKYTLQVTSADDKEQTDVVIGIKSAPGTAEESGESEISSAAFIQGLAAVLKDKNQGSYTEEITDQEYLRELGIFDNIENLTTGAEPLRFSAAAAMAVNALSKDKEMIMAAGGYPTGYRLVYDKLIGTSYDTRQKENPVSLTVAESEDIFAAVDRYVCDTTWETAYSALQEAGVVAKDFYTIEILNQPIPRAETAVMVAKALKTIGASLPESAPTFTDMSDDYWAAAEIGSLQALGIINGYEDGSFRPDDSISQIEMWKMCICAAKLDNYGEWGEYPEKFKSLVTFFDLSAGMGNQTELFENINETATHGQVMQMIYNVWFDTENEILKNISQAE